MVTGIIFYALAILLLLLSFLKDRDKTVVALRKAWKSLEGILPQFLGIIVLIGILLAVFDPAVIQKLIGSSSGWRGTLLASAVGSITLIPGFIAFPTAAMLLKGGAGYMQIAAFNLDAHDGGSCHSAGRNLDVQREGRTLEKWSGVPLLPPGGFGRGHRDVSVGQGKP